jgi:hypothetical protein
LERGFGFAGVAGFGQSSPHSRECDETAPEKNAKDVR